MKTVYFLRHGQTKLNKILIHQYPEAMLSETGREQAKSAAAHFKDIPIDVIIASSLARTTETARIIAQEKSCSLETENLLVELRRPRVLWGTSWLSPKSLFIMGMLYFRASTPHWHHSDEENLEEFHVRGRRALEYLADRPEQNILVVTHKGLMANLMSKIKTDGLDTIQEYRRALWYNLKIHNCCYFTATWSEKGENGKTLDGTWKLDGTLTCPGGARD